MKYNKREFIVAFVLSRTAWTNDMKLLVRKACEAWQEINDQTIEYPPS